MSRPSTSVAQVHAELRKILQESLPRSARKKPLEDDTKLRDVGVDSLGLALLVARFAETFGIDLAELGDDLPQPQTVGELFTMGQKALEQWEANHS